MTKQVNSTSESQPEDTKQKKKKQQTLDNISFNRQSTSRNNLDSKDSIKWTFHFFD